MPAITDNSRFFLQNTDYPADQVIYMTSGSFTVPASGSTTWNVLHALPFIPLCGGNWSLTSDFSTTYEYSTGVLSSPLNVAAVYANDAVVYADSTFVYIASDNTTASPVTVYYRVYAFQPSDSDAAITPVLNNGDTFILNTGYNITKLFINGTTILPATTSGTAEVDITHNLGYIPQAQAWIKAGTYVHPCPSSATLPPASQSVVSPETNILAFGIGSFTDAQQAWWRIYCDD